MLVILGFTNGSVDKESNCNVGAAGDVSSIPGTGKPHGEGSWQPTPVFFLKISMDRGAWQAPWGHKESDTTEHIPLSCWLFPCLGNTHTHTHTHTNLIIGI